jgi:hypothetical protein
MIHDGEHNLKLHRHHEGSSANSSPVAVPGLPGRFWKCSGFYLVDISSPKEYTANSPPISGETIFRLILVITHIITHTVHTVNESV